MRNDLTDITVVMDRSGSMSSIQSDAEGGLNTFIQKQKESPGFANLTLIQFDHEYQVVHRGVPIQEVGKCSLVPRGQTALLDAVGRAIVETGERLKAIDEKERPGLVVFVILTDGQENKSREYTKAKVKEMVEHQQNAYKWQFTYLGANQDAFAEAGGIGINLAGVANYQAHNSQQAFQAASSNLMRMRGAVAGGQSASNFYTDQEQAEMDAAKQ